MPEGARGMGLDILWVEDDEALAVMYRLKLAAEGHRVETAVDGPGGLRAALERPPHLLLLDVRLPGFDGLELLVRLRQVAGFADLPVIVLSNSGEPEVIERGVELGAVAHLIKSRTTPTSLAVTIRELVSRPAMESTGE